MINITILRRKVGLMRWTGVGKNFPNLVRGLMQPVVDAPILTPRGLSCQKCNLLRTQCNV